MYTVIRFRGTPQSVSVRELVAMVNSLQPGACDVSDVRNNCCSCSLSLNENPCEHFREVGHVLGIIAPVLAQAQRGAVEVEIDLAIHPEEYEGRVLTEWVIPINVLAKMAEFGIPLGISLYGRFPR